MITPQSASIIWEALPLVTLAGTNVAAIVGWRRSNKRADGQAIGWELAAATSEQRRLNVERLERVIAHLRKAVAHQASAARYYGGRAIDAEEQLAYIKAKRHASAVKARQAQLSQQRAKVLAKASELTPVPVDTRKAA